MEAVKPVKPLVKTAVKTAIVGLGRIASLLEDDSLREKPCTHAGAVAANPGLELVAGSDLDAERRELFARRWKVPVYEDASLMLEKEKPGILIIATHPDSHEAYCRLAAKAGVPVAVSEKPLASGISSARRIAELHRLGKIKILVNHERRYASDYRRARAILGEGRLGRMLGVRAVLYMGRGRRLIDVLWHDGTHLADAAMFLSGRILKHRKTLGAALRGAGGTAFLLGALCGKDEIPFSMELGAERDHLVFELEFSCERGRLRIGNNIFEIWESGPSPYAEKFNSLKKNEEGFKGPSAYFFNMIDDAYACCVDAGRQPLSGALDGLRAIEYLNSVRRWV
jgi:predicted dehydrogenase